MLLDAPAFVVVLTPESALGLVAKEVKKKLWGKVEFEEIRLVYTPYWVFSFDVAAEGGQVPSGKAALNAFNGDISEFVPMLLEKPLKKTSSVADDVKAEIEKTAVKQGEVKEVAALKIAGQTGLKKEQVSISAVSKIYVPSYRTWVDVAGDSFKVEVEAALGVPSGLDAIPSRTKNWDEVTAETINKMKSPAGIADLTSQLFSGVGKAGSPQDASGPVAKYGVLFLILLVLLFLVVSRQGGGGGSVSVDCKLDDSFLGPPRVLGLFGDRKVIPRLLPGNQFTVSGSCFFTNGGDKAASSLVGVRIMSKELVVASNTTFVSSLPPTTVPVPKEFEVVWTGARDEYSLAFEKLS